MAVIFSDPFASLFNLQQTLDASRASSWLDSGPSGIGSYPPVNVFRKGDDFVVLIELAGIKRPDLEIQVKDNTLRIAGRRQSTIRRKPVSIVERGCPEILIER